MIAAIFIIFVLGCANTGDLLTLPASTQQETNGAAEKTALTPDDTSTRPTSADSGQTLTETPRPAELRLVSHILTPTPLLPQPTLTPSLTITPTGTTINAPTPSLLSSLAAIVPATVTPTLTLEPASLPTPSSQPAPTATLTPTLAAESQPEIHHVIIITIDGLRPDALELADTPALDNLKAKGVYFPNAQTVIPSFTLPAHVSMLDGVVPQKHGIVEALPCIGCRLSIGPTLFNVAHDAGLSTGMIFGKEKLDYLVLPNSVDQLFEAEAHDPEIKQQALEFIEAGLPHVLFIHFPDVDRVGHDYGWMSAPQLQAVTYVDGLIGEIVAGLKSNGYLDSTLLIITADHGGHNQNHGDDSPVDRTIPWLAVGPGVPSGITETRPINIYDTAPTVLYALNLPIPEQWDGQPILEIFQ